MSFRPYGPSRPSVLLLLSLLACGRAAEPTAEPKAAPDQAEAPAAGEDQPGARPSVVVRLGYQKIGPPFLLEQGDESLIEQLQAHRARPEWVEFQAGPPLLEAMRAGAVDIGYVGETPPVFAQSGGVPFVYVATDPPAPRAEAIIVPGDSPIQTVAQLAGKRVAVNRGSNVHYLLVRALESEKLTLEDVEVVFLAPADARAAFESGKVDAWVIWDPFLAAAELAGARSLRDGEGLVDNHLFYVVRREFAEQHAALVRVVLGQYQELSEWAATHPEDAARILAESSGIAYDALLRAERRHPYGLRAITPEVLAKQQSIADTFHALGVIPKAIRTADAFLPAVVYGNTP
jgi:sulfonate transport system substrate-binding protein